MIATRLRPFSIPLSLARGLAFSATAVMLAVLPACAKAGGACSDTPGSCVDKASHLVCANSKYVLETCKGKGGCSDDKSLTCDNTKADVGDGCGHDGARACSVDGTKELRCRGGQFKVEWSCRNGCTLDASQNPKCTPMGQIGDVCRADSIVCDVAQKSQLDCAGGKLAQIRTCHGALGCETTGGGGVRCDRSQALEGEACQTEGTGACDMAKKNVLLCQGGHFTTKLHCLGPIGCELPGNYSVRCDKSIVDVGEACADESAISCSAEGKQLKCESGKFVIDKTWKPKKGETCSNRYRVSFETEKFEAR
ncbi:MAG: hypothetical protein ACREJ3_18270 [Polyangiaceae bacterium]